MKKRNKRFSVNASITVVFVLLFMISAVIYTFAEGKGRNQESREAVESTESGDVCNFLFLGTDDEAKLSDVIIIASVDLSTGNTNVLQIPRDTYFAYTEAAYKKINGAPRSLGSVKAFAELLSDSLGVEIDHYLSLDLSTLEEMVDMVSGVEVDVPCDMDYDDPDQELSIHLKAGKQTLDGKSAIQFVRYRSGYLTGDIGRIDAQKLFLRAFSEKMKSVGNPILLYKIFRLICSRSDTDMSESDMIDMALFGIRKNGTVSYVTLPGEAVQSESSGAWYYILSRKSTFELLSIHFGLLKDENDFDKSGKFVDKTQKAFYDIYNSPREYIIRSSDDLENNLKNIN